MDDARKIAFLFILRHPIGLNKVIADKMSKNPVHVGSVSFT
jgi:hypothetical protein